MKTINFLAQSNVQRTHTWLQTIYVLVFVFIYFAIIWILFGDFNVLKLNLIVFPGMINPNNPQEATAYAQIDPRIYYFLFVPGIFYMLSIFIIRFGFKQIGFDMVPMVISSWMAWVALILSGTFANPYSVLVITGRIVLILSTFLILFFSSNIIVNYVLGHSRNGSYYFAALVKQELAKHEIQDTLKSIVKINDEKIIDVDPKNIFRKVK